MDGKIGSVSLVVRNKAAALAYYVDQVGFEKKTDITSPSGYRFVTVGPKGQELQLALWELGSTPDSEQVAWSKQWAAGATPPIVILVSDCRKTYAELHARGVEFPQEPKDYPWGVAATFRDPDGNLFSISQLRSWRPK